MKRVFFSTILTTLLIVLPAAALPDIPVKVTVGLDEGTKALLERLPDQLQQAFVAAVTKSLKELDFHVETYVKEIQSAASQTVQNIACTGDGFVKNVAGEIGQGLTTLLVGSSSGLLRGNEFATPPNVDPSSQTLLKNIAATRSGFRGDTPSTKLYAAYSDLAFAAAGVICQDQARNAPTDFASDQLRLMRRAIGEWRILDQIDHCQNPEACIAKRKHDIESIRSHEDPKLIEAVAIQGEYDELGIGADRRPIEKSNWQQLFDGFYSLVGASSAQYDISHAEAILFGLRDIELRIAAVRSNWQQRAQEAWAISKKLSAGLPNFLLGIAGEMNPNASGFNLVIDSENAFHNLGSVKKSLLEARRQLELARSLDPRLKDAADAGLADLGGMEKDAAAKVEQICSVYLNTKSFRGQLFFNSSYGAYSWCSGNPADRWAKFPTPL